MLLPGCSTLLAVLQWLRRGCLRCNARATDAAQTSLFLPYCSSLLPRCHERCASVRRSAVTYAAL